MCAAFACCVQGLAETEAAVATTFQGAQVVTKTVDISSRDAVYSAAATTQLLTWGAAEAQPVFALVNNAGIVSGGASICNTDDARIVKTFEVNTLAHFWAVKAFLPAMKAAGAGHIVDAATWMTVRTQKLHAKGCYAGAPAWQGRNSSVREVPP